MARILGVGIATLDIINTTDGYPNEDDEVRAVSQTVRRGGNVANTQTVLSQLGHQCLWAGTLADDPDSALIRADLQHWGIDMTHCAVITGGHAPTSYITLNQNNGSRTIVHYRELPEYGFEHFMAKVNQHPLNDVDWLHLEGRNVPETVKILEFVRHHYPGLKLSLEIEKPRQHIEQLYSHGDMLLFSRHFSHAMQFQEAGEFLRAWRSKCSAPLLVCPWGAHGAYAMDNQGVLHHEPAVQISQVVDTIGAGDTFNAAMIHAALNGFSIPDSLCFANALAGKKCGQAGFDQLITTNDKTLARISHQAATKDRD
jgi:ketohexokinase